MEEREKRDSTKVFKTLVATPTIYDVGICVAPCVCRALLFPLTYPLLCTSLQLKRKSFLWLFFYRSVAMIFPSAHFKPANRSPEYFSMASSSFPRDVHKNLIFGSFFRSSLEWSRWKIYTPLQRTSSRIQGNVHVNGNDAWIYRVFPN